jgi:DNA-directed RNA polymerase specialized sigma24 family protein
MKIQFEDWDESFLDLEDYQVERALTNAALDAIRRARTFGTKSVIWEDERVKLLGPEETKPDEQRLLENVERLNRKIAELQAKQPNAFELNERAEKPKNK